MNSLSIDVTLIFCLFCIILNIVQECTANEYDELGVSDVEEKLGSKDLSESDLRDENGSKYLKGTNEMKMMKEYDRAELGLNNFSHEMVEEVTNEGANDDKLSHNTKLWPDLPGSENVNDGNHNSISKTKLTDIEEISKVNEMRAGDVADLFGTNQHYHIPVNYPDFGRRFVLQYPYREKEKVVDAAENELDLAVKEHLELQKQNRGLIPVKASPELVLNIAKQSVLLEKSKPRNPTDDIIQKDILRTGQYWNDVWKEDVDENILRTTDNKLESLRVKIAPGSKLYQLVSALKEKSPRLLYVIHSKNEY